MVDEIPPETEAKLHWAPEQWDPSLLGSKVRKVLLLTSYCEDDDNPTCTDEFPCVECLQMCNVVLVEISMEHVVGSFAYLRDKVRAGRAAEPEEKH